MHIYFIYIVSAIIPVYVFWLYAKEEGFLNEDVFDISLLCGVGGFILHFILGLDLSYTFLGSLFIFLLFIGIKKWSFRKVGDTAIGPFVLFLYFVSAFNVIFNFSGINVLLFGVLGLIAAFLSYLRHNFFLGVSSKRARMTRFFGTFLNGTSFYLGLLLVCITAIIFSIEASLIDTIIYSSISLGVLIAMLLEIRKPRNSKMVKEQVVDKIKSKLLREKAALEKEEKLLEMEDSYKVPGRDSDNADLIDDVDEDVSHEVNRASLQIVKKAKGKIKKALFRLKKGKYGICESCGGKIEDARLEAYPEATLCIKCARKAKS